MLRFLVVTLLSCAAALPVLATTAAVEHPGSLPILLGVDKVRAQLKLDSLQRALLDSLRAEYKSAARKLTNPMPVSAQEREVAGKKLLQLNERFNQRALSILSEAQRAKLVGIERRLLGATMVYAPSVQTKLGLTEEQKQKVESIRREGLAFVGKINRKFEAGKIGQQQRVLLLKSRRTRQSAEILQVLTPKQRETVQVLEGQKLES
ncbi:MAG TPA: hypothetical protein VFO90_06355 [Terrimicrobiaceae bacterium]|nr:hypothetical protein [Terrimicrobiaceae bacterium]